MSVQKQKPEPPQPILIQGGKGTEPEAVKAEPESAEPLAVGVRDSVEGLEAAIDHYELTLSTKPSTVGMSVLGLLLIVVVPFLLVLSAFESGDDDAAVVCCFSFISGIVLLLVAQTKESAWQKQIKLAKQRVINEAGLKAPPTSKTAHFVFGVFAFLVILAPTLPFYYSDVISAASIAAAGIAAVFALSKEAEAKKILDRNFKAILEQRGNEQE